MAKVAFSKLGLKLNNEISVITHNEVSFEVKNYLPINDKLDLLTNVINNSIDDHGYYNEGRVRVFFALEVIDAYTNLSFTEKQKEDPCKLYDLIVGNGIWGQVWNLIPGDEREFLETCLNKTVHAIYEYKNSVLGLLESVSQDYSGLQLDATAIQQALGDPNNMALLRDVLTKLG